MRKENDLGKDDIKSLLFRLSVPAITAQIINALYNIVDRIYIGHIEGSGDLALTGLGLCFPVIMLVAAFAYLIGQGGAPIAAIYMGKQEDKKAETLMGNCLSMLVLLGFVLMIGIWLFMEKILFAVGASENTIQYAMDYLRIYLAGTIPVLIALGMNMFINTQGYSKTGMATVLIGAVLNIILDPIFIYGFGMGVKGAAWATILSQTVSALWVLKFLFGKRTKLQLKVKNLKLDFSLIRSVLGLGIAPFVMASTESMISIVLNSNLQKYGGDIAVGAMTIMSSVMQFIVLPLQGLCQGAQPIISYNFGAKQFHRVKKTWFLLFQSALVMSITIWIFVMTCTRFVVSFFTNKPELIDFTVPSMRVYLFMIVAIAVQVSCQQSFLATGQAKVSLFLAMLRKVILLMPLAILFGFLWGTEGIFLSEPIADFLAAATTFILFMKRRHYIFGEEEHKK